MTSPTGQYATPESPASPSASFYDLSDDEEGEYNTIMHSSSGRGVKLLFSKSKVEQLGRLCSESTLITTLGLCSSYTLLKGQYPWVHRPYSAKITNGCNSRTTYLFIFIKEPEGCILPSCLVAGVLTRKHVRRLRKGRSLRFLFSPSTDVSRTPATYNHN